MHIKFIIPMLAFLAIIPLLTRCKTVDRDSESSSAPQYVSLFEAAVSTEALDAVNIAPVTSHKLVNHVIKGAKVTISSNAFVAASVSLVPSNDAIAIAVDAAVNVDACSNMGKSGVRIQAATNVKAHARKMIYIKAGGVTTEPAFMLTPTQVHTELQSISATGIFKRLKSRIGRNVFYSELNNSNRMSRCMVEQEVKAELDKMINSEVYRINAEYQNEIIDGLIKKDILVGQLRNYTFKRASKYKGYIQSIMPAKDIGFPIMPARKLEYDPDIYVQLHEHFGNRAAEKLLSGRSLTASSLRELMANLPFQGLLGNVKVEFNDSMTSSFRFAEKRPVTFMFDRNLVVVTVNIVSQDNRQISLDMTYVIDSSKPFMAQRKDVDSYYIDEKTGERLTTKITTFMMRSFDMMGPLKAYLLTSLPPTLEIPVIRLKDIVQEGVSIQENLYPREFYAERGYLVASWLSSSSQPNFVTPTSKVASGSPAISSQKSDCKYGWTELGEGNKFAADRRVCGVYLKGAKSMSYWLTDRQMQARKCSKTELLASVIGPKINSLCQILIPFTTADDFKP